MEIVLIVIVLFALVVIVGVGIYFLNTFGGGGEYP